MTIHSDVDAVEWAGHALGRRHAGRVHPAQINIHTHADTQNGAVSTWYCLWGRTWTLRTDLKLVGLSGSVPALTSSPSEIPSPSELGFGVSAPSVASSLLLRSSSS